MRQMRNVLAEMIASDLVACHSAPSRRLLLAEWQVAVRRGFLVNDLPALLTAIRERLSGMLITESDRDERRMINASLRLLKRRRASDALLN